MFIHTCVKHEQPTFANARERTAAPLQPVLSSSMHAHSGQHLQVLTCSQSLDSTLFALAAKGAA
jgi:hypothetical protein